MEQEPQDRKNGPDLVAALIRAAGRRTEPPADVYQQVLTAATAAFREKSAKRRGRTLLFWAAAASVAALALAFLLQWNVPATLSQVATVERVIGTVELAVNGGWRPMTEAGAALGKGARMRTLAGGGVALALDGGASMRLAAATEVLLDGPRRISLQSGTVYLDNKGSVGTGYQIETPAGTARDVGTQFELRVTGGVLRLRVREGRVEIDRAGQLLNGSAGEQLEIDVLGGVTRSSIAATDMAWQWAETMAPAPDIDGQPATVLLTWVARETGRRLHYESAAVETRAATVILHGNIRHLAPLAALDVMLATTDLEYALVGDTMEVRTRTELAPLSVKSLTLLLLASLPGVAGAATYQGQTVEQALEQLRERGLALFYSSDLVKSWMRIEREPAAAEPRALLAEILAPHGIVVTDGPNGALMLVREIQRAPRHAAPGAPHRPAPTPLDAIVVSASTYLFGGDAPLSSTVFSADDLEMLPEIGEDPLRAVSRLPGVARPDYSSRVHLRGGTTEETLVRFDDLRLYDPFHFKDFYGVFSTIDPGIVSDIRVYTGGFPVTFGDSSSGVVEVAPRLPGRQFQGQAVLSLFTAGISADGSWDDGTGDWAIAARRSNLGEFFDLRNSSVGEPDYHDLFAHIGHRINDQFAISANALTFLDQIVAFDTDQDEEAQAEYRDAYYWLRLDLGAPDRLGGRMLVARTDLDSDRMGTTELPGIASGSLVDERDFTINSIQADAWWRPGARSVLQAGAEWRQMSGVYRYTEDVEFDLLFLTPGAPTSRSRSRSILVRPSGHQAAAYVNWRFEPTATLTTDLGLRWDRESLAPEDGSQTSPRAVLMWRPREDTWLRLSWGRYFQAQGINELQVSDGEQRYSPAQQATHLVASIEHDLSPALKLRAEAYRKEYKNPLPRYELLMNTLIVLPELKPDRILIAPDSALAEGAEISLNYDDGSLSGWLNFSWSQVYDRVNGEKLRRLWDQRHYASGGLSWRGTRWETSVAANWHTGWRTTAIELATLDPFPLVTVGRRNARHLSGFVSIDLRFARHFDLGSAGELTAFVEVNNLLERKNQCCVDYQIEEEEDPVFLDVDVQDSLPLISSVGFVWKF